MKYPDNLYDGIEEPEFKDPRLYNEEGEVVGNILYSDVADYYRERKKRQDEWDTNNKSTFAPMMNYMSNFFIVFVVIISSIILLSIPLKNKDWDELRTECKSLWKDIFNQIFSPIS